MHIIEAFKWINRQAVFVASLVLFLGVVTAAHWMAVTRLEMINVVPVWVAGGESEARFIAYVDEHPWVGLSYAALFVACLIWLQFRHSPRRLIWLVFTLLAIPALGYIWICLRLGTDLLGLKGA